ncbi:MAG: hypothetical protein ACO3O5_08945, partial [Burkholderiaceae bacterium]
LVLPEEQLTGHHLLEATPGDGFGSAVGGCDVPVEAAGLVHGPAEQLNKREVGFAEASPGADHAEAVRGIKDLALCWGQAVNETVQQVAVVALVAEGLWVIKDAAAGAEIQQAWHQAGRLMTVRTVPSGLTAMTLCSCC